MVIAVTRSIAIAFGSAVIISVLILVITALTELAKSKSHSCDYTKLRVGMTRQELTTVCPYPSEINGDSSGSEWYEYTGSGFPRAYVEDGKVVFFQYTRY